MPSESSILESFKLHLSVSVHPQYRTHVQKSVITITVSHSQIGHHFFSYLFTYEVYIIKVLKIMAQIGKYIYTYLF